MRQEIAPLQDVAALKQGRNDIALQHGLPPIGTSMVNEHGIEWLVDGHSYVPDLTSLARDSGQVSQQDPRDLLPVIIPQNTSQRLQDFWVAIDRCTSKYLVTVDTLPALRPQQAHADGHWVDAWSDPNAILFFLDAAHVDESIFAHEMAHVWIDLVEDCEDYRVLRDLADTSRARQLQYVQSFVLDRKVNDVLRDHGFDLSLIEQHQCEMMLSLARAVIAGYKPPYVREAATIALLLATTLLEQEAEWRDTGALSLILCYDGTVAGALRVLRQELPEIYALAEHLAACVQRHGYANRQAIGQAIDGCLKAMFDFTGDPLDLDVELEEVPPTESYRDKWPDLFPGWSVQAKLEVGKAMAKHKLGSEATWRTSYTFSGQTQIEFQEASGSWTQPIVLSHAPSQPQPFTSPQIGQQRLPVSRPPLPHRAIAKAPRVPTVPTAKLPPSAVVPSPVQVPMHGLPNQAPRRFGRDYMPGVGRWLSRARLQEQLTGEHPYSYAGNNPINRIDPSGLDYREAYDTIYWYRQDIKNAAAAYHIPAQLLAGVVFNEVYAGGKPFVNYLNDRGSILLKFYWGRPASVGITQVTMDPNKISECRGSNAYYSFWLRRNWLKQYLSNVKEQLRNGARRLQGLEHNRPIPPGGLTLSDLAIILSEYNGTSHAPGTNPYNKATPSPYGNQFLAFVTDINNALNGASRPGIPQQASTVVTDMIAQAEAAMKNLP